MSFVEQHKRWLLPLLGAAVAGVVWMNLPDRAPQPQAEEPSPAAEPESSPAAPAAPALAADLQALAAPPPSANDPAPLLQAGRQAIAPGLRRPAAPPRLHPALWLGLFPFPDPEPPAGPAAPAAAPPRLDFIIDTGTRQEAWVRGRGYAPGAVLEGGYRVKRIDPGGILVSGPRGEQRINLGGQKGALR